MFFVEFRVFSCTPQMAGSREFSAGGGSAAAARHANGGFSSRRRRHGRHRRIRHHGLRGRGRPEKTNFFTACYQVSVRSNMFNSHEFNR